MCVFCVCSVCLCSVSMFSAHGRRSGRDDDRVCAFDVNVVYIMGVGGKCGGNTHKRDRHLTDGF